MFSRLYVKDQYISPNNFIISTFIREYDISKANISILLKYGGIDQNTYDKLYALPGIQRQIRVGYMCGDNERVNSILKDGFKECRKDLFQANSIQDMDILNIRKDAIFLINKIPHQTEFGPVKFLLKNMYTSYYKIGNLEFFYYMDKVNGIEKLDVKGIDDNTLIVHNEYMLEFLKFIFETAETYDITEVISIITSFYKKYINLELDVGYYREMNPGSQYNVKSSSIVQYKANNVDENMKKVLDINCNRIIIETLSSYYSSIYFNTRRNNR